MTEQRNRSNGHLAKRVGSRRSATLQIAKEVSPQSLCKKLIALDSKILYSSYLDSEGRKVGEAAKMLIELYDQLTLMVLPLHPSKEALVLAAPFGSDLTDIVTKATSLLNHDFANVLPEDQVSEFRGVPNLWKLKSLLDNRFHITAITVIVQYPLFQIGGNIA